MDGCCRRDKERKKGEQKKKQFSVFFFSFLLFGTFGVALVSLIGKGVFTRRTAFRVFYFVLSSGITASFFFFLAWLSK